MEQLEGFVVKGQEKKVCKLVKSIYGLKQAGQVWYEPMADTLRRKLGLNRCTQMPECTYFADKGGTRPR